VWPADRELFGTGAVRAWTVVSLKDSKKPSPQTVMRSSPSFSTISTILTYCWASASVNRSSRLAGTSRGRFCTASLACVPTWHEDFKDLARIDVPTLVIHGNADCILPITASGQRTAKLIKGARAVVIKDGPHCITWTHADEVNLELVNFLGVAKRAGSVLEKEAVA
jgi:pimeloyl-ACP methyl ester carboxylesterase